MPLGAFFRIRVYHKYNHINTMNLIKYLKETKSELKEVVFPSTSQTVIYTVAVILISVFVALSLGGIDLGLREGLTRLLAR